MKAPTTNLEPEVDERGGLPSMSSAERTIHCAGWIKLSRELQLQPVEHEWTRAGTLGHAVLADELGEGELEGEEDVAQAVRNCDQKRDEVIAALGFEDAERRYVERRFWMHDLETGEVLASGKPDLVLIKGKTFLIPDYKLGRNEVTPPATNSQLVGCAIAVQEEFFDPEDPEVTGHLAIIPAWKRTPPVAKIDSAALAAWRKHLEAAFRRTRDPNAPRVAGKWCDYCPARPLCPQALAVVAETRKFSTLDEIEAQTEIERLVMIEQAEKTCKEYRAYLRGRLEVDPVCIPGLTIAKGRRTEGVKSTREAWDALTKLFTLDQLVTALKWSLTSLAKIRAGQPLDAKALNTEGKQKRIEITSVLGPELIEVKYSKGGVKVAS